VDGRGVGDRDQVVGLGAAEAQLGDGLGAVVQQPLAEGRVGPGARHHLGAVLRPDVALVQLHDRVDGVRGDQALLGQQRLERGGAQGQLRVGTRAVVVVSVVSVLGAHPASSR
jgi:hypothetical protein